MYGILGIHKPKGMSSFDVIRLIKKRTGFKKMGHGGTLDPMAEGVLPILMGEAAAYFDALLQSPKTYEAQIQLGSFTDTDDAEGAPTEEFLLRPLTLEEILPLTLQLTGEIFQVPPIYSALKVDGKRAYDLARQGHRPELQARKVTVYGWENVRVQGSLITARIHCSSGTYIRSLARSLGERLALGGHLSGLKRTACGGLALGSCIPLEAVTQSPPLIPVEEALSFLPQLIWEGSLSHIINGKPLSEGPYRLQEGAYGAAGGLRALVFKGRFLGLVRCCGPKISYQKNLSRLYETLPL